MLQKEKIKTSVILGMILALFIMVSGFGMMLFLWNTISYPKDLLGLFDYKAATWGDAICLPIMCFCLVAFIHYNNDKGHTRKKIIYIITIIAIFLAILTQGSWLWSNTTKLNWSIPIHHHFNLAGWYHSVFFIMMFGVITCGICKLAIQVKDRKDNYSIFEQVLFGGMIASGSAFLLLHCFDDYSDKVNINYMFPLILFLIMIIIFTLLKITRVETNKSLYIAVLYGILTAFSFASIVIKGSVKGDVFTAFGMAICSYFIVWKERESLKKVVATMIATIPYFVLFYYASAIDDVKESVSIVLFMFVVATIIEKKVYRGIKFQVVPMFVIALYMILQKAPKIIAEIVNAYEKIDVGDLLFYIALYILFERVISNIFNDDVVGSEIEFNNGNINRKTLNQRKKVAYFKIIVTLSGIISLLCRWEIEIVKNSKSARMFSVGKFYHNIYFYLGIGMCVLLFFITKMNLKNKQRKMIVMMMTVVTYICVICNSWFCIQQSTSLLRNISIPQIILVIVTIFAVVGTSILISYGFNMNLNELRNREEKAVLWISKILFIGGLVLSFTNVVILVFQLSITNIIVVIFNILIMCEVIPVLCTFGLGLEYVNENKNKTDHHKDEKHIVPNEPYQGVLQDGFSTMLLQIFVVGVPCIYINILKNPDINGWISLAGIMIPGMIVVEFFIRNNVGHVERQERVLEFAPNEKEIWEKLRKCLIVQNFMAIFATLPFCICQCIVISFGAIVSGKASKSGGLKQYLISTYITKESKSNK